MRRTIPRPVSRTVGRRTTLVVAARACGRATSEPRGDRLLRPRVAQAPAVPRLAARAAAKTSPKYSRWPPAADTQGQMSGVNEIRSAFLDYFAEERARSRAVLAAGAAQRPDPDVHQCRHGAVQERLHRAREAAVQPRGDRAEMRARRRQAQRPRQCRLHGAPQHLLRDARQLLVRRLLQGRRDRARLEPGDAGLRAAEGSPDRHRLRRRRRGLRSVEEDRRPAGRAHHPHRRLRQFLGHGRHRSVRSVLGDLLRPRRPHPGRAAGLRRRRRRPFRRDLEPGVHAVRAARPAASASTCRSRRSTPAWGSSASRRCCRAPTTATRPTCSAR